LRNRKSRGASNDEEEGPLTIRSDAMTRCPWMWAAIGTLWAGTWGSAARAQAATVPLPRKTLEFRVVGARDNSPLPDVSIVVSTFWPQKTQNFATDPDGRCRIPVPTRATDFFQISVRKEGMVPIRVDWSGREDVATLPESYTLPLTSGTSIGGTVRNQRGEPIPDAHVYVWLEYARSENHRDRVYLGDGYYVTTDALGKWRCAMMPADLSDKDYLGFHLFHPDYLSNTAAHDRQHSSVDELRTMSSEMVMEDGVSLTGRVVDLRGRPLREAQLFIQEPGPYPVDPESLSPDEAARLLARTDADGWYRFGHVEPGEYMVGADAEGHARRFGKVVASASPERNEIRLPTLEEADEIARRTRHEFARILEKQEAQRPKDIPQRWVLYGFLIVAGGVVLIAGVRRWIADRQGRQKP